MKPFYWRGTKNFGDYLNTWLWPRLLPDHVNDDEGSRLIGIGSLLKSSLNLVQGRKVIFGTGSGYGNIPSPESYRDWDFRFVRGPLTAKCFDLPSDKSIVDGAWLLGLLPEYEKFKSANRGTIFVPHWTSAETGDWARTCATADINYIDPEGDLVSILKTIATSELVITESLHGAIIADLFRVPWIPVRMSPQFLPFKWLDWFQSVEIKGEMRRLPLSDFFDHLYHRASIRGLDYTARPCGLSYCEPQADNMDHHTAGMLYRLGIRTKRHLRAARKNVLGKCRIFRGCCLLEKWNRQHQTKLANSLKLISQSKPFLSSDSVWSNRMDKLHVATEKFKQDYCISPKTRTD